MAGTVRTDGDDYLVDALIYFGRASLPEPQQTFWFDIYKAFECLEKRFGGNNGEAGFLRLDWAPRKDLKLLKQTANWSRHARRTFWPPPHPTTEEEAKVLMETSTAKGIRSGSQTPFLVLEGVIRKNVQSLFDHHEPSRDRRAVPRRQPLRRQPRADAGRFPGLSRPVIRNADSRHRNGDDALGHAAAAAHRRPAGHEHPQHVVAALARLAEAGEPLPGAVQQLRRIRAGAEP